MGVNNGMRSKKYLIFNAIIIAGLILVIEIFLRVIGLQPGVTENYITIVDSLVVNPEYIADEAGIEKLSQSARDTAIKYVNLPKGTLDFLKLEASDKESTLKELITHFHFLENNYTKGDLEKAGRRMGVNSGEIKELQQSIKNSEFYSYVQRLKLKLERTDYEEAVLNYVKSPINSEGFRSIEFKEYEADGLKVLLLGNSLTWGRTANPIFNSFGDILLSRGYITFNTGIVCIDPAQYEAVAKKYIPIIKPDIVIVNYFGNDNMYSFRETKPYQPFYYFTNAGVIMANPVGYYMSAEEVYKSSSSMALIPENSTFNRLCSKTVLSTRIWKVLQKIGVVGYEQYIPTVQYNEEIPEDFDQPISEAYIDSIAVICERDSIKMLLAVVPDPIYKRYEMDSMHNVFKHTAYHVPSSLTEDDYVGSGDDHFNNSGNLKYANFLQQKIDSLIAVVN